MKWKPFFELNHWTVRELGAFKLFGFQKMRDGNKTWYVLELYLCRIGLEVVYEDIS